MDIGDIYFIKGGVSRTVAALTTIITDLNLKVNNKVIDIPIKTLRWFNESIKHFVVEFSDERKNDMPGGTSETQCNL